MPGSLQQALKPQHQGIDGGIEAELAERLKVSRRLLDLRFRELQGTTLGETIIRLRLEEVKRLLRSTKEPIDSIAAHCGYENPNYLKNLFKKRFAMSMRDFRGRT